MNTNTALTSRKDIAVDNKFQLFTKRLSLMNSNKRVVSEKKKVGSSSIEQSNDILKLCSKTLLYFLKSNKHDIPQKKLPKGLLLEESLSNTNTRKYNRMYNTIISQFISTPSTIKPNTKQRNFYTLFSHKLAYTKHQSTEKKQITEDYLSTQRKPKAELIVLKERTKRVIKTIIKKQEKIMEENRQLKKEVNKLRSILVKHNITMHT